MNAVDLIVLTYQFIINFLVVVSFVIIEPHLCDPDMVFTPDLTPVFPSPCVRHVVTEHVAHVRTWMHFEGTSAHPGLENVKV